MEKKYMRCAGMFSKIIMCKARSIHGVIFKLIFEYSVRADFVEYVWH